MLFEGLLTKIAAAVFKKAAIGGALKWLSSAVQIYSVFDTVSDLVDCIETTNDCRELSVSGVEVVSNTLTEAAIDKLVTLGSTTFEVQRNSSGLYVASSIIPKFALNPRQFPVLERPSFSKFETQQLKKPVFPKLKKGGNWNV